MSSLVTHTVILAVTPWVEAHSVPTACLLVLVSHRAFAQSPRAYYAGDSAAPFGGPNRDVQITGPLTVNLRAKRDDGDDRTYGVVVTCSNYLGKSATRYTLVRVPCRAHETTPHQYGP